METLKIAFFAWESVYTKKVGGLAPAATYLAEKLAEEYEVHYFTRGDSDFTKNGVHFHCVDPAAGEDDILTHCKEMSERAIERVMEFDDPPFDILHFHDWHFFQTLQKFWDRKCILSIHSTEYGRNGGAIGDSREFGEISAIEKSSGEIASHIITVSRMMKVELMWLYDIPEWKISTIPNGTDPYLYYMDVKAGAVKKKYGIHPLAYLVLFVGRVSWQKGPDILVEAVPHVLARRADIQFIIAGKGDMLPMIQERSIGLPIQCTGYVSDQEHLELLNAADLVCIPSRNEPFGLVLTEAWSAGKGVVASDVGGLSMNISNLVDGIKVPPAPEPIAWAICYAIGNPDFLRSMGIAGRKKVLEQFNWKRVTEKTHQVYIAVMKPSLC
ncbi:MAG: glycosyltransferase family 1 protein [Methanocalculus sp. MSAO_Arc2]|uniref:glycosyltransferase family 4 protein n=1 Tax=Methanocalculus sp. MSAO_Arc2 TaxID=2293855 RepID=UPI000FEF5279|nr:MAG: glycosyltransferase family 1 protein [Methanocalculus sp. MSAO_Arc2]